MQTLTEQNAIAPAGVITTGGERVLVRIDGQFEEASDLEAINLRVGDRFFPLSDVASVSRGYEDPPESLFRFEGEPAYALAIGMVDGGNILEFGEKLHELMTRVASELPVGIEMHHVADQPEVVSEAVGEFVSALVEAALIVLAVIQYRLAGEDISLLREQARSLASMLSKDDRLSAIALDWAEPARSVRVQILQDRVRQLGLSPRDIAGTLNAIYVGQTLTELRDDIYLVDVIGRGGEGDRDSIDALTGLQISTPEGSVSLRSLATFSYGIEPPLIRQENGVPTITVKAAIATEDQPETIVTDLSDQIDRFRASLPSAMSLEVGGEVETSAESQNPIAAVVPLMLFIMVTLATRYSVIPSPMAAGSSGRQ